MRISDWSSDVCSSDLPARDVLRSSRRVRACRGSVLECARRVLTLGAALHSVNAAAPLLVRVASGHVPSPRHRPRCTHSEADPLRLADGSVRGKLHPPRSEEHTSELQALMRTSYAVFCLKKKNNPH